MLEAGLIVSRFLHYVAAISLFGAALFPLYTFRGRLQWLTEDDTELFVWLRRFLFYAALLALVSGLGWFAFTTASMAGDLSQIANPVVLSSMMLATDFGPLWAVRLVLIGIIAVLLIRWPFKPALWLVPLLSALILASLAGTGHAPVTEGWGGGVHIASDVAHLVTAGIWLGGLWPLGVVVAASVRGSSKHFDDMAIAEVLQRFSRVGTITVAVLAASGLINSWFLVGSPNALVTSTYGWVLLAKIAVFLLMALLATANHFWITPQLTRGASASPGEWLRRLRWHVIAEQMLGIAVLVLVSVLGTLQPGIQS